MRAGRLVVLAAVAAGLTLAGAAVLASAGEDAAEGDPPDVVVESAVVPANAGQRAAVVYLELANDGGDGQIVGASAPAGRTSLHAVTEQDGLVGMTPVDAIDVPAGGVALGPGTSHVMLEELDRPISPGDRLPIVLELARSGSIEVTAEVVGYEDAAEVAGR